MTTKQFIFLFFFGFINLASAQEKPTFSDQQFKLSFGPARGQPPLFATFEWSKGLGVSVEYNNHFSKRFSWGCELGFTFDSDYEKTNHYSFYIPSDGYIYVAESEVIYNFMRTQYSIIPQISYHIMNKPKFNLSLTGGFGICSEYFSNFMISPNGLFLGNRQRTFRDLNYVGNFALSFDYKISPHVFAGIKVQDHIFGDEEFRSLRISLGYIID